MVLGPLSALISRRANLTAWDPERHTRRFGCGTGRATSFTATARGRLYLGCGVPLSSRHAELGGDFLAVRKAAMFQGGFSAAVISSWRPAPGDQSRYPVGAIRRRLPFGGRRQCEVEKRYRTATGKTNARSSGAVAHAALQIDGMQVASAKRQPLG